MNKYDEAIGMIIDAASFKMALNSHKGNIEDMDFHKICDCAIAEIEELRKSHNGEEAIIEAADVFNFLIAAVVQATANYRRRK
jgi:triphosphoribosyl-dephospho-CoA synthetase